jgi:hypothetical protein
MRAPVNPRRNGKSAPSGRRDVHQDVGHSKITDGIASALARSAFLVSSLTTSRARDPSTVSRSRSSWPTKMRSSPRSAHPATLRNGSVPLRTGDHNGLAGDNQRSRVCLVAVYAHSHGCIVAFGAATLTANIRKLVPL